MNKTVMATILPKDPYQRAVALRSKFLSNDDIPHIVNVQAALADATKGYSDVLEVAADAIMECRKRLRAKSMPEQFSIFPRRIVHDPTQIRHNWKIVIKTENGQQEWPAWEPSKGADPKRTAIKHARQLFLLGNDIVGLIPPDIDPVNKAEMDEHQRNTSGFQPQGLTVRQREKKH